MVALAMVAGAVNAQTTLRCTIFLVDVEMFPWPSRSAMMRILALCRREMVAALPVSTGYTKRMTTIRVQPLTPIIAVAT